MLQKLLDKCEQEFNWLGMSINVKKSCCMRVGPRYDAVCVNITTGDGRQLPWVKEIRYLGIHIVQSRHFKSATDNHKKSFFRSFNAIFGKVGRIATDEVIAYCNLFFQSVYPCYCMVLESVSLTLSDVRSLDFTFNRFMIG